MLKSKLNCVIIQLKSRWGSKWLQVKNTNGNQYFFSFANFFISLLWSHKYLISIRNGYFECDSGRYKCLQASVMAWSICFLMSWDLDLSPWVHYDIHTLPRRDLELSLPPVDQTAYTWLWLSFQCCPLKYQRVCHNLQFFVELRSWFFADQCWQPFPSEFECNDLHFLLRWDLD